MKKLLVGLSLMFACAASATTVNLNWIVDEENYARTTCEFGGDLDVPSVAPTKYGYTFRGWEPEIIQGSWTQPGTPTPTNPIEPVFYPLGNTVLRALGTDENFIADTYNPATGKITRRVGVLVLGNKSYNWREHYFGQQSFYAIIVSAEPETVRSVPQGVPLCNYYSNYQQWARVKDDTFYLSGNGTNRDSFDLNISDDRFNNNGSDFNSWLTERYNAGQPVTFYYPLPQPIEEYYTPTQN